MQTQMAWRENRTGVTGSLLLHGAALGLWLWWSATHPLSPRPPLNALLVDIVHAPPTLSGASGGAANIAPPRVSASPRPQGVKPDAAQPVDELEARIAALANRTSASPLAAMDNPAGAGGTGNGGGYGLADYVRAQILRRWWPQLDADAARNMAVTLSLRLSRSGEISDIRIVDLHRFENDARFHGMALSARNAAQLASPIALPPGNYEPLTQVTITLDPRAVLR